MPQNHMDKLLEIMRHLRSNPEGCAWTKEQTHTSLVPYLTEEAFEAADAIDRGAFDDDLRDELGDVLLQIVFHSEIAAARGAFTFDDVAKAIVEKLIRRYPTILGDEPNTLKTAEEIDKRWEEIKAQERKAKGQGVDAGIMEGVSKGLPALMRAAKLKGRAAKAGWEWPDVSMLLDKVAEEVRELRAEIEAKKINKERVAAELGDLLFLLVDFGRWHGVDAEEALRTTNGRVERRFSHMEQGLKRLGKTIATATREERLKMWEEAKRAEEREGVTS